MRSPWPVDGDGRRLDRRASAERLVRENRVTVAVVVPLVGGLLLVADAASLLPSPFAPGPVLLLLGTTVMRLPLLVALAPLVDRRVSAATLSLSGFVYVVEFVGVTTGWPYGQFHYVRELGPMLFGAVPVGLPLFFLPLVVDAYLLSLVVLGNRSDRAVLRLGAALGALLVVDLILDPGAVTVGFWAYDPPGGYYGVPASNYAGWLLSGGVATVVVDRTLDRNRVRQRLRECEFALDDLVSFAVFWGVVNVAGANWTPVLLTAALLTLLLWVDA